MVEKRYKLKRTKIVGTIGPSSLSKNLIRKMILAGLNVCRINFSHSNHENALKIISIVNELNIELNSHVAIMGDLQGPKLRIGQVEENNMLAKGDIVKVIYSTKESSKHTICVNYPTIASDVKIGERILLDDGKIILRIKEIVDVLDIVCEVLQGGELRPNKGLNLPNTIISLPTITPKDKEDLEFCVKNELEWVALSFVRSAKDIKDLKALIKIHNNKSQCKIIAKIEKPHEVFQF